MADFDITELCARARVTPRTVHFYVQQGLLPPAGSPGPGARYSDGHISRIKLIRLLQKQHLPLAEIAKRTRGLSDAQVDGLIVETKQRRAEGRGSSALEYIRGVLSDRGDSALDRAKAAAPSAPTFTSRSMEALSPSSTPPPRSQWERFTLADGIELHVRRPMSRTEQRQLEKLMAAARNVFDDPEEEEQ